MRGEQRPRIEEQVLHHLRGCDRLSMTAYAPADAMQTHMQPCLQQLTLYESDGLNSPDLSCP